MRIKEVIRQLTEFSPLHYAEDFDNVGLLVGDQNNELTGVLVTLDTLEAVVDEAIEKNCNLIVSFHPIIFKGLKKITGKTYVERVVMKAIKNDIAIYAIHTALDNHFEGVNARICEVLQLSNPQILTPQKSTIKKLQTYVPNDAANQLREALFEAGAGAIGNYENCSFNLEGVGTFKGNEKSNPVVGEMGKLHSEKELQIGITFPAHLEGTVVNTLMSYHPYEEVAYEVTTLENTNQHIGLGMVGTLLKPMSEEEFLEYTKKKMKTSVIRHSQLLGKNISKVAVLGGSGAFAIGAAMNAGADIFLTADLKYHDFFSAENRIVLADIGHYESEQYTKNLLVEYLTKKITNFAVVLSTCNTNPVKYF